MSFQVPYPKPEYTYSGHCRQCGGWVMLIVDDPHAPRDVGKTVGNAIKHGAIIKRTHDSLIRAEVLSLGSCKCDEAKTANQSAMELGV